MAHRLPDDAWTHVGAHLKPRHLSKLMRTSKHIKRLVDNEGYWTRVAAHLVWRANACMELQTGEFPEETDRMPPVSELNLYYMVGLDRGYCWGMERFLSRIQETIDVYSQKRPGVTGDEWWAEFHGVRGLRERTIKMYVETAGDEWYGLRLPKLKGDEDRIDMKELARRVTILDWVESKTGKGWGWPKMRKYVCELEDDPMPAIYKRRIFRNLNRLIWSLLCPTTGNEMEPSDIANDICIF